MLKISVTFEINSYYRLSDVIQTYKLRSRGVYNFMGAIKWRDYLSFLYYYEFFSKEDFKFVRGVWLPVWGYNVNTNNNNNHFLENA